MSEQDFQKLTPAEQTERVLEFVARERQYQRREWGNEHDDTHYHTVLPKLMIKRLKEAVAQDWHDISADDAKRYDELLLEVAALAVAAIEQQQRASLATLDNYEDAFSIRE